MHQITLDLAESGRRRRESRSDPYHGAVNQTFSADVAAAQVGARQWRASATIATSRIAFSSRILSVHADVTVDVCVPNIVSR